MKVVDLKAGRRIDALVGQHVMGLNVQPSGLGDWSVWHANDGYPYPASLPTYSKGMRDAWPVFIQGLIDAGDATIHANMEDYGREQGDIVWVTIGQWQAFDDAPLAICKAALLNKGIIEVEDPS